MSMPKIKMLRNVILAVSLSAVAFFLAKTPLTEALTGENGMRLAGQSNVSEFVTVEAVTPLQEEEKILDARERSLNAAKDEAILKAAAAHVNPSILIREKSNLAKICRPQRGSLVEEIKILSEGERDDGTYRVRITAKVNGALLKDFLLKHLRPDRVVVVTMEKNQGRPLTRHILEHDLIARVKQKGYAIVDYRTIKTDKANALVAAVRQGNTKAVHDMGLYYLTDVVVVGFVETKYSERTQDIHSSHATGQVKIHRIGSRKELASVTRHSVKGFGGTPERAGIDAIGKITPMISAAAVKILPVNKLQRVKLYLREVDHYAAYRKAKYFLSNLSPVKKISDGTRNFRDEEASVYVWITGSVDTLVEQISELKKFVITEVSNTGVFLTARKLN